MVIAVRKRIVGEGGTHVLYLTAYVIKTTDKRKVVRKMPNGRVSKTRGGDDGYFEFLSMQ